MPEVEYTGQTNKRVLLIDLAGVSDYRVVPGLIEKAIRLARSSEGPGSLRTLIDLNGTRINGQIITSVKTLSRNNGRYAKATAFVGLSAFFSRERRRG